MAKEPKKATLKILGDIRTVLDGKAAESNMQAALGNLRFAIGCGSYAGPEGLGESFVIDSQPYVTWVKGDKLLTESKGEFRRVFLVGIDQDQEGAVSTYILPPSPVSMQNLYADLAKGFPEGFAILGSAQMTEFHSTYLKKPPIYHENINEKHDVYWEAVGIQYNQPVLFFGIVIPEKGKEKFASVLPKVFYQNPGEKHVSPFESHTHAALLQGERTITGVRHLLTQSIFQEGICTIYPIGNIEAL